MKKRKVIDISTKEKRKEVFEKFNSFGSKNQAHIYFGISDNKQGSEYLKEIANEVGFDLTIYKKRQRKPIRYCKQCGKEIKSKWGKEFCCSSCAATYNNEHRDKTVYEKIADTNRKYNKNHPKVKKIPEDKKRPNDKYCKVCGKKLEGHQHKYCSKSCRNRNNYLTQGQEFICQECGKIFKSRNPNRKFCSNECCAKHRGKETIDKWLKGKYFLDSNSSLSKHIRLFLYERAHYKCEECGFEGYNKRTNNTILQIHHIDGNCGNNSRENLKVLCPNCHAMTENYMALNKGKSARFKRYKGESNLQGVGSDC